MYMYTGLPNRGFAVYQAIASPIKHTALHTLTQVWVKEVYQSYIHYKGARLRLTVGITMAKCYGKINATRLGTTTSVKVT